jgi:hypothetical protein
MSQKSGKGDALRKEKGIFAYFCCRTKVWRLAGRDPPVLILRLSRKRMKATDG